jgi:DNA-binding CsgD family transcriptional regulator
MQLIDEFLKPRVGENYRHIAKSMIQDSHLSLQDVAVKHLYSRNNSRNMYSRIYEKLPISNRVELMGMYIKFLERRLEE